MKLLPPTAKMNAADFSRTYRQIEVGPDVFLEDLMRPGFWVHHADKLNRNDIIDVISTDGALDVQLRVTGREKGLVFLRPLRIHNERGAAPESIGDHKPSMAVPDGYVVDYTDATSWRARTRNPAIVLATGLKSEAEAVTACVAHAEKAGTTSVSRDKVIIPENWRDLSWQERRSLASKLTDEAIHNGDEANTAIEAELAHRSVQEAA